MERIKFNIITHKGEILLISVTSTKQLQDSNQNLISPLLFRFLRYFCSIYLGVYTLVVVSAIKSIEV